ncbi:hypothetical protein [Hymenobacter terricola]|uniref:hypothetical protein n=1 Tax=Hymenobacter terricola TaxID=2819236 RepID=UPI001B30FDF1|nr:hypothetical protein [Hymenobacter terricola]
MPTDDPADAQPPTLLTTLGPGLMLPRAAVQQLFALPGDALPQAITRLTGLTRDDVRRFAAFDTAEALDQALRHEPARFYYYALVGWLAYDSPLGEAVRERLHDVGEPHALALAEAVTEGIVGLLAGCVPTPTADTVAELQALFAQEKHGLVACLPALAPPGPPPASPPDDDDAVWLAMTPRPRELRLFSMALYFTHTASYAVPHPLGRALPAVAALGTPAELIGLAQRFKAAGAEAAPKIDLGGPDVIRLYLSLQVLALLFVAELQPVLMSRLNPTPDGDTPWLDPRQQQNTLRWVCTQVEAFGMLFDDLFGDEPSYHAAKATARELAALV